MSSVSSITIIEGGGGGFVASGDLSGTSSSQTVIGIRGVSVSSSAPTTNQLLAYNGTSYIPIQIANANVSNTAAITYSKLSLSNSVVNADINSAAAIVYSKLSLTGNIVNADISNTAAIAGTKISPAFGSQNISNTGSITQSGGTFSLTGNANSSITTSSGNTTIDAAAALNLGTSTSTSLNIGLIPSGSNSYNMSIKSKTITMTTGNASGSTINIGAQAVNLGFSGSGGSFGPGILQIQTPSSPTVTINAPTTIGVSTSGNYAFFIENFQSDNTGYGLQIFGGGSAGGTPGAILLDIQNQDNTDILQMVQDTSGIGVDIVPGADNNSSLGTATLGFANVCTHGFDWLGTTATSATAGTHGDVPAQVLGYIELQVAGSNVKIPYYNV